MTGFSASLNKFTAFLKLSSSAIGLAIVSNFEALLKSQVWPSTSLGISTCTGPDLGVSAVCIASFKILGIVSTSLTSKTFFDTDCIKLT